MLITRKLIFNDSTAIIMSSLCCGCTQVIKRGSPPTSRQFARASVPKTANSNSAKSQYSDLKNPDSVESKDPVQKPDIKSLLGIVRPSRSKRHADANDLLTPKPVLETSL